jgi:hypothetical protein
MSHRLRVTALLSTFCGLAIVAGACSDDSGRDAFVTPAVDSGVAHPPPEGAPPSDAGSSDAATDASADVDEVVTCDVEPCAVDIVAGQNHFCVLMSDKRVRCWGDDTQGSLGYGAPAGTDDDGGDAGDAGDGGGAARSPISTVQGLADVTQISAGATTSCARMADGAVKCWGGNDSGQLGLTTDSPTSDGDPHPTPAAVALTGPASRIDVGARGACAVLSSGDVFCWGANDQAQLARPTDVQIGGPAKVATLTGKVVRTAVSMNTSFAVDDTGRVSSWGAVTGPTGSVSGRVASVSPDPLPQLLPLDAISSFAVSSWRADFPQDGSEMRGIAHACAISRGKVSCWGASTLGAMGFGVPFAFVQPSMVLVREDAHPQRVAVSIENTCLRMTDGSIQCAGDDSRGQLGRGADAGLFSDFFTVATAFKDHALRVALSDSTACVIVRGGKVQCWGGNSNGELARGTTDDDPHPTPSVVQF